MLQALPRVEILSDFHCVTTWSVRDLRFGGWQFSAVYNQILAPRLQASVETTTVVFRCADGYRSSLPLGDLLALDVLLADRLEGEPLSLEHGAPLRVVAPAHYGYKSAKHLNGLEFWDAPQPHAVGGWRWMDHPRARVAEEERGRMIPARLLRWAYRPFVEPLVRRFREGSKQARE